MRKQIKEMGVDPDEIGFSRAERDKLASLLNPDNQSLSLR